MPKNGLPHSVLCPVASTAESGVRLPNDRNHAKSVRRYKGKVPAICFLALDQTGEQFCALAFHHHPRPEIPSTKKGLVTYSG